MIKSIAFDLDDTLIDGKRMHHAALIEALNKFGYKRKRVKWIRGATTEELLVHNFPHMDYKTIKRIAVFKRSIVQKYMGRATLISGALQLLRFLKSKGLKLGLITNNSHKEIKHFLRHFKLKKYFSIIIGLEDAKQKPSDEMFLVFMKKTKLKKKEIIYVGDSNYDILACKKAGIKIILVTKIHKTSMFKKADFVAKNLKQVKKIIGDLI